jgi:hypothetical protein
MADALLFYGFYGGNLDILRRWLKDENVGLRCEL